MVGKDRASRNINNYSRVQANCSDAPDHTTTKDPGFACLSSENGVPEASKPERPSGRNWNELSFSGRNRKDHTRSDG